MPVIREANSIVMLTFHFSPALPAGRPLVPTVRVCPARTPMDAGAARALPAAGPRLAPDRMGPSRARACSSRRVQTTAMATRRLFQEDVLFTQPPARAAAMDPVASTLER